MILIRQLYAMYLRHLVTIDERELRDRTIDGTASDRWACAVRQSCNERLDKIDALLAPRVSYRIRGQR